MKTYRMSAVVGVSAVTVIRAASRKEAMMIARDRQPVIDQNDGQSLDENWLIEEADGEVRKIVVEEVT